MAQTQAVGAEGYSQWNNQKSRLGKSKDDRFFEYVYRNPHLADELDPDEENRYYEWAEKKEDEEVAEPTKYEGEITDTEVFTPSPNLNGRVNPNPIKVGTQTREVSEFVPEEFGEVPEILPAEPTPASPDDPAYGGLFTEDSELSPTLMASIKVKHGDTLWAIAKREGTSVKELMQLNDITDPRKLRAGQDLKLPTPDEPEAEAQPRGFHEEVESVNVQGTPIGEITDEQPVDWEAAQSEAEPVGEIALEEEPVVEAEVEPTGFGPPTEAKAIKNFFDGSENKKGWIQGDGAVIGNKERINFKMRNDEQLSFTVGAIKRFKKAEGNGWRHKLAKRAGYDNYSEFMEANGMFESRHGEQTTSVDLNSTIYNIGRLDKDEISSLPKEGTKQRKWWNGVKDFVFLDSDSTPTRYDAKKLISLKKEHGIKWKEKIAISQGYENWNELMENNGYLTREGQDREFRVEGKTVLRKFIEDNNISMKGKTYDKNGGLITSESRTGYGTEPHRLYGGIDIVAAALGDKQKQDEFIQYMLKQGYRLIDERDAWSDKKSKREKGIGRGILHFDKRPFIPNQQHLVEKTHELDKDGNNIQSKPLAGHTSYRYIKTV